MTPPPKTRDIPKLAVKGLNFMICKFSPVNTPIGADRMTLQGPQSAMHIIAQHRIAQLPPNTLWWNVASVMPSELAVVRERVRRRVTTAIREVLKEMGYDDHGRSLVEGKPSLKGSLEVRMFAKGLLNEEFSRIKREASLLLNEVEWQSTKRNNVQATVRSSQRAPARQSTRVAYSNYSLHKDRSSDLKRPGLERVDTAKADSNQETGQTGQAAKPQTAKSSRPREVFRGYIPYRDLAR